VPERNTALGGHHHPIMAERCNPLVCDGDIRAPTPLVLYLIAEIGEQSMLLSFWTSMIGFANSLHTIDAKRCQMLLGDRADFRP